MTDPLKASGFILQANSMRMYSAGLRQQKFVLEAHIERLNTAKKKLGKQNTKIDALLSDGFAKLAEAKEDFKGTRRNEFDQHCQLSKDNLSSFKISQESNMEKIQKKADELQKEVEDLQTKITQADALVDFYEQQSRGS